MNRPRAFNGDTVRSEKGRKLYKNPQVCWKKYSTTVQRQRPPYKLRAHGVI